MAVDFSLDVLEFPRLKSLVARYVRGALGRGRLERLVPTTDREELDRRHAYNREAMEYLRESRVEFTDIPLLAGVLDRAGLPGTTLEIEEIEAVQDLLAEVNGFRSRWKGGDTDFPLLVARSRQFPDLRELGALLGRAVRAGAVSEDYSPELRRIRRESEQARQRLNRKLESVLRDPQVSGQLQDQLITQRNGRYVVPVRVEQKRSVQGIVHGMSSSGATVFMEPLDTLEMNNDIVRLREEEEREIQRILGELSDRIGESADALVEAAGLWAEMEVLFGIARFGRDFDCTAPEFSANELVLVRARHPLLVDRMRRPESSESAVPLDIALDEDERVLVISGPNAGGKTVVLKTIGLLSLMAQSGLPVPAETARLPMYDRVLADIGDQQSIANQLSTFSAHVLALTRMIGQAGDRSLILIDEIGSSTEPSEGAALGIAVLEHFRAVGSRTVATTHFNRLKMYAETTDNVRNAAMEFNEATLEPTYKLIHGLAGQSSGLKIAERLRLPADLIAVARQALDRTELDAARYVEELRGRIGELESDKARLEGEKEAFGSWKRQTEERIESDRKAELGRLESRLDAIVDQIRKRAADQLKSMGSEAVNRFDKNLKRARVDAGAAFRREAARPDPDPAAVEGGNRVPPASKAPALSSLGEGMRVRVLSLGVEGALTRVSGKEVEVAVGNMKMRRPVDDIEPVDTAPVALPKNVNFDIGDKRLESNEIHLIGRRAEEVPDLLDKFLDDAFLTGLSVVRVVHGHGMGILRRVVGEVLGSHPHVARFESASRDQGGDGATLAYLRD
jgi:DNA mismatch repair protein MutS2